MRAAVSVLAVPTSSGGYYFAAEAKPARPYAGFLDNLQRNRIFYGEDAEEGQFPHQLSLMVNSGNYHTCGAILVMDNVALTAAHCVNPA